MEETDPYDQHLLAVFETCDDYYRGSISAAGLHQLCEKLQLQDQHEKLSQHLLGDLKSKRILFDDFKNSKNLLLKLSDGEDSGDKTDEELSSAREIPPKYVLGKKKYRRHSKLESNENEDHSSDDSSKSQQIPNLSCSADDSSSEESVPKKRRTRNCKRKERKSFSDKSGKSDSASDTQQTSPITSTTNEVEHLVTAWSSVSRGVTKSLNRNELVKVFQCVGLERGSEEAAQCVFEKLGFEENGRITLQELLEFIRSGDSWNKSARSQHMELETTQKNVSMEYMESSSLGCISGASLIEQWENAGVPGATQLIRNLGFSPSQQIDLVSLASLLTDEIKSLSDEIKSTRRNLDPHVALLRANSVLQNVYIQSLKDTIEHVNAEKEKLRNDVFEANQRAMLLAQEVDDHHSKLELSSQQQVKLLEQKHFEKIRELTNQAKTEQEALLAQNAVLEKRLKSLEEEVKKNKVVLLELELENNILEQEHRTVVDQLAAVQLTKEKLEKDLENVSVLQQRVSEMEATLNENDVISLLERIQSLESENTNLRDRNDELSIEVEELSTKLLNTSLKKRTNSSNPVSVDQSIEDSFNGGGMKRRGDSFVLNESAEDSGGEEGSPRLGKVRKCSHAKEFAETTSSLKELQIHGGNRGECVEDDSSLNSSRFIDHEDVIKCKDDSSYKIMPFSEELEQAEARTLVPLQLSEEYSENLKSKLQKLHEKLQKRDAVLCEEVMTTINEIMEEKNSKKDKESVESLKNRCQQLESSLELLKEEYEKTEDYWSEKLEEERGFFEEEQKLSDKKYSELLKKILEYEAMWNVEREQKQRLETIEEKDNFEKQVTDMEQECSELRSKLAETVREKEVEVEKLKNEVASLRLPRQLVECGVQVNDMHDTGSSNSIEESNRKSYLLTQSEHKGKKFWCNQCSEVKLQYQRELEHLREEREKLFKKVTGKKQRPTNHGAINENERIQELEQKCHSLMVTLKHQQKQTENILKNTWKQHKAEVKDLKSVLKMTEEKLKRQTQVIQDQLNKLAKTDLLVKDLFVENAYLISSVQKLEEENQSRSNATKINPKV